MYICLVHAWEFRVVLVPNSAWLFYCVPAAVDVLYVDSLALKQASELHFRGLSSLLMFL